MHPILKNVSAYRLIEIHENGYTYLSDKEDYMLKQMIKANNNYDK